MSMESRKNNSVSFNLLDDFELKLLEHAEKVNPRTNKKRNFSKYVKQLIADDLLKESQVVNVKEVELESKVTANPSVKEVVEETTQEVINNQKEQPDADLLKMYL